MLFIELTLDALLFGVVILVAVGVGYLLRKGKSATWQKKIADLEKEMLMSHAEILELQREKKLLEQRLDESRIPVIALTSNKEDKKEEISTDVSIRKKLLAQPPAKQQSL
jgi:hypothetical protein